MWRGGRGGEVYPTPAALYEKPTLVRGAGGQGEGSQRSKLLPLLGALWLNIRGGNPLPAATLPISMTPQQRPHVRADGRAFDELRPVRITTGYQEYPEGSALIACGNTRVLCAASVQDRQPPHLLNTDRGWVTAEYAMLPRATHTRSSRESVRGRLGGRTQEIQRLIGRALRAAVDLQALGPRTVILDCDVLQADGGTRTAAITGAYVALALALHQLVNTGMLTSTPLKKAVAAVSVGIVHGAPFLDLSYPEDSRASADLNVVMTGEGQFIEVQGTAEGAPFSPQALHRMLDLAHQGIKSLLAAQERAIRAALDSAEGRRSFHT